MADEDVIQTAQTEEAAQPVSEAAPIEPPPLPAVTSAAEWKRRSRAVWRVTLPSAFVVDAKRPDFAELVGRGIIDPAQLIAAQSDQTPTGRYEHMLPVAQAIVPYVLVSPRIGEGEDCIALADVQTSDMIALFLWAGGWGTAPAVMLPE